MSATIDADERLVSLFRTLSDVTRIRILRLLAGGERCVSDVCQSLGLVQPTASHHLGLLRVAGLVENRRAGKQIFYRLGAVAVVDADLAIRADGFEVTLPL